MNNIASKKYVDIIVDAFFFKKPSQSDRDFFCDMCGEEVDEGDKFYFVDSDTSFNRICSSCHNRICRYSRNALERITNESDD